MKNKIVLVFGVLMQLYFVLTWSYALAKGLEYEEQQSIFNSFWSFFPDPYYTLLFLFIVTGVVIFIIIQSLHTGGNIVSKRMFLIVEFLFLAYIGFGLL